MRDPYHAPHVTTKLIFVLIGAFLVESLLMFYGNLDVLGWLGLTARGIAKGKLWQLFTFQFLHECPWPWHVLFNCLGLWFFGRPVEELLGAKKFLTLYLAAGVAGGLLQVAATLILPHHPDVPVVGASAGICGVIAIFCSLHPMQELTMWVAIFPIAIRAKYLLIFLGGLSLFGTFVPFDNIAHGAHLGGIVFGMGYVRWGDFVSEQFSRWNPLAARGRKRREAGSAASKVPPWLRAQPEDPSADQSEEFISRDVDPILDKISAHGIQSLTEKERKILEAARKKMGRV